MRLTSVIFSAALATASVLPNNAAAPATDNRKQPATGANEVKPVKPQLTDLQLNHSPADGKEAWNDVVPELEHVGLAKRSAEASSGGGGGFGGGFGGRGGFRPGCKGIECHRERFRNDRHDRDEHHHDRHRDHEHDGYEERYYREHIDNHHHDSHHKNSHHDRHHHDRHHHHNHCHHCRHNRCDHCHQEPERNRNDESHIAKRDVEPETAVKAASGGDDRGDREEYRKDRDDRHRRKHRFHEDHHDNRHRHHRDDVEYFKEEIIHHDDHRNSGHRHHDHHHNNRHGHHSHCRHCRHGRCDHCHDFPRNRDDSAKQVDPEASSQQQQEGAAAEGGNDFHTGLTEKHICGYFHGIAYKAHELQRTVEQLQYENVPWLTHNQGPWQHVLNGLRQIEWVLGKLGNDLRGTSAFTEREERELVGCYFSFAGIDSPNGDQGEPFKKLLCMVAEKAKLAKYEPYAQRRVYNVVKDLEKTYLSTGEQLVRSLRVNRYRANITWDIDGRQGIRKFFRRVLNAFRIERKR